MHRIKTILIALAIIVTAAISFKSIVMAAQVTRINKNKGLIVINGNKDDGFVMGATVCFYSSPDVIITCGRIRQTSESRVTVKVNNRMAKQIHYGMEAQLEDEEKSQEYIKSKKEEKGCVYDSECGYGGNCINCKCQ